MRLPRPFRPTSLLLATMVCALLSGCDQLGLESASAVAARREAEGKAIGGGCRHAARSIEACYESNKRADKAAVFAGWREMNDYMRENKIDAMPAPPPAPKPVASADGEEADDAAAAKDTKDAKAGKPATKVAAKGH